MVGVALLLLGVSAGPDGVALTGPRWVQGDELHYTGEVLEASDRIGNRFRKKHALELRVFVLAADRDAADCAVLTILRPLADPAVAGTVGTPQPPAAAPAVRLDFLRVDDRGRTRLLRPAGSPPLALAAADTAALPLLPLDGPPVAEFGFLVPFPAAAVRAASSWDVADADRPPVGWKATGETVWNGGRCLELAAVQQSTGFDQPDKVPTGWKRTETAIVSPADGYASSVTRTVVRREGREAVGSVTVSFEQQPRNRAVGVKQAAIRKEIETAWAMDEELKALLSAGRKTPMDEYRKRAAKVDQYLSDVAVGSAFRPAVEAVRRRYDAVAAGVAPPAPLPVARVAKVGPPVVGDLLDDFILPDVAKPSGQFRLSGSRGVPVLLMAYRPSAVASAGTVKLASALQAKYGDRLRVVPVAVFGPPDVAADERKALKLDIPIYDGRELEKPFALDSWPVFLLADGTGKLRWTFDAGLGKETGLLICKQVEALLK